MLNKEESQIESKGGEEQMGQTQIRWMKYNCLRCGHIWIPRTENYPKLCPKCMSAYWDREPKAPLTNENEKQ
jgi:rubrerythrin